MPASPSPNVLQYDKERRGVSNGRGRRAVAVDSGDAGGPSSYLSPTRLLSSFSSMGIRGGPGVRAHREDVEARGFASWQECDLGDGLGQRALLVISSPTHALQILSAAPSTIPDDPHVQETFPAPEEIVSVNTLKDDRNIAKSVLPGISPSNSRAKEGTAEIVAARLVDRGPLATAHGPVALLLLGRIKEDQRGAGSSSPSASSLEVLSLRTGVVVKRLDLGQRSFDALDVSARYIVLSAADPSSSLIVLDSHNLQHIRDIQVETRGPSTSPVFALSGRLLAYATSEPPHRPGPDGSGTLVTAKTLRARSRLSSKPLVGGNGEAQGHGRSSTDSPSGMVLSSAIEIGGGVARGVWAGLKMGAQAAGRAGVAANQRLATSAPAPTRTGLEVPAHEAVDDAVSESRSLDDDKSSVLGGTSDEPPSSVDTAMKSRGGGQWIKMVDLGRDDGRTIAHFRLPRSKPFSPPTASSSMKAHGDTDASLTVDNLAFSPDGTALFASPSHGRVFHLFDIRPTAPGSSGHSDIGGEVWHTYELRRGNTAATVSEVKWAADRRWLGVATQRGTVHVFPIHPCGGPATPSSHVPPRLPNPTQLSPLSTVVMPSARVRPRNIGHPRAEASETPVPAPAVQDLSATFTFQCYRSHPLRSGVSCLDILLYRPALGQSDLARLSVRQSQPAVSASEVPMTRRASALTDMMRARVGMNASNDLSVESAIKVTWHMPQGTAAKDDGELYLPEPVAPQPPLTATRKRRAYAEIQTFSHDPRLLPPTIYLSHQVDYYDARPIDEYSRLSVIDREARTRRLHFRPEVVELHPDSKSIDASADVHGQSFDDALHSVMMDPLSSPSSQLPGLPNGPAPTSASWKKASIPIRQVKESAAALQRGYVARSRHRHHPHSHLQSGGVSLSFEDDTVLAMPDDHDPDHSGSSPLSSEMPRTEDEDEREPADDEEWGVSWEAEYARAVEDDGAPDDLVLGLMDEQEEERKRWVARQQRLVQEYAQKRK